MGERNTLAWSISTKLVQNDRVFNFIMKAYSILILQNLFWVER